MVEPVGLLKASSFEILEIKVWEERLLEVVAAIFVHRVVTGKINVNVMYIFFIISLYYLQSV
jgi:hypothetical protein